MLFLIYVIYIKFDFGYEICSVGAFIFPSDEITISDIKIENSAISSEIRGDYETTVRSDAPRRFRFQFVECFEQSFFNEIVVISI